MITEIMTLLPIDPNVLSGHGLSSILNFHRIRDDNAQIGKYLFTEDIAVFAAKLLQTC